MVYKLSISNMEGETVMLDITTPPNAILSAFYKRSFAYHTVKERMPRILTQVIDTLVRNKDSIGREFGKDAKEELKLFIGQLSKLKYEIQTNKAIQLIESNASDVQYYNDYIIAHPDITHYTAVWLFTECYMYRRIQEVCELSTHLKDFDCFQVQKRESHVQSIDAMERLGGYFLTNAHCRETNCKEHFMKLLKLNLWGNKADLSFSNGQVEESFDPFELLPSLDSNILCDHSEQVWEAVSCVESKSQIIDMVLDNTGYEVFTDMCIADFLLTNNLAKTVRLYVKTFPYFISDVTRKDLTWTINEMKNSCNNVLHELGVRWDSYIDRGSFIIVEDDYWISALDFCSMGHKKPELYKKLSEAKFIMFKGDLNYRKLIGEKNWDPTTPFEIGLQGFGPAKLCTLRTLKCGIVCGLQKNVIDEVEKIDPEWAINGNYGVIQSLNYINILN